MLRFASLRVGALLVAVCVVAGLVAVSQVRSGLAAPSGVSLAGVHFYGGDISLLDPNVPPGQRGWNVEHIPNVSECREDRRGYAQRAKGDGLVNIIRMDYAHPLAVPLNPAEYESWKNSFRDCVALFGDIANIYIVGNEPNLECGGEGCQEITATQYANAFNYLFARKGELRAGTELLAVANSPFTSPIWMYSMTSRLVGVDGIALHTGGAGGSRAGCVDPRQPCTWSDNRFDGTFRYYRDVINQIDQRWWNRPVYITEFNTFTGDDRTWPSENYPTGWVRQAFQEIRHYNTNRNGRPEIKALIWFVDEERDGPSGHWWNWALSNPDPDTRRARADLAEEFRDPANRTPSSGVNPHLDAFVRGTDNQIWHRWHANGSWSPLWERLPFLVGGFSSDPTAVAWGAPLANGGAGRIDVFARCGANLCHTWFDGLWHDWTSWGNPGVALTFAPDAASWSWGNLMVFAVGADRKIYQINYTIQNGRTGWQQPIDGTAVSGVSVVSWGSGRLDLFVRGTENQLWHRSWIRYDNTKIENGVWGPWQIGTGVLTTGPDAASWGAGHIDVFAAGTNSVPWRLNWNNGTYAWQQVPDGSFTSDPGAAAPARNRVSLFARGLGNNYLWHKPWVSGWGDWEPLDGVLTSGPDAASWSLR